MLLVHRVTPFVTALVVVLGVATPFWVSVSPLIALLAAFIISMLLLSRLGEWKFREPRFWFLLGSPMLLVLSAYTLLLFLESDVLKMWLGIATAFLVFFFTENVFTFLHLPAAYQIRAIEHLSLVINVVSLFFAAASLFGFRLFLSSPLWLLAPMCFLVSTFLFASTLWMCKVDRARRLPYALGGAVMTTELFAVMNFLPSGFFTNAALLTIFFYLYLGLSHAFILLKLSPVVLRRYVVVSVFLAVTIIATAKWE